MKKLLSTQYSVLSTQYSVLSSQAKPKAEKAQNVLKSQQICNNYAIYGRGPIIGFRLDISFDEYLKIHDLDFSDLLKIFPGLKYFYDAVKAKSMKAYGRANRKVRFGDHRIETIRIQRIIIKADSVCLDGSWYEIDHDLYNILPTFLVPYKRYIADSVYKCAAHNRHEVINNTEEFPAYRTTFRWQQDPCDDRGIPENGCIVVFDMDRKAFETIMNRETFRKCRKTGNTRLN